MSEAAKMRGTINEERLKKSFLPPFWQDSLNENMEKYYPEVIGFGSLVSSWKVDGYNDGTTTLYGVYQLGGAFVMCSFPDYREPSRNIVSPVFEHTGWQK